VFLEAMTSNRSHFKLLDLGVGIFSRYSNELEMEGMNSSVKCYLLGFFCRLDMEHFLEGIDDL